jgi:signal peptidase II
MKRRYLPYLLLALAVFLLDQATKYFIMHRLTLYQVVKVLPFFNIVYYRNVGSAFGLFKSLGNPFFIVVSLGAILAVSVLIVKDADSRLGFSLILAGAAGNLADRVIRGYVIDFLEVYAGSFYWPAFNVADSALTVGIAFLIVRTIFDRK